jgi:gas vesicle protein
MNAPLQHPVIPAAEKRQETDQSISPSFQVGYLTGAIKGALIELKHGNADTAGRQLRNALADLCRRSGDDFFEVAQ